MALVVWLEPDLEQQLNQLAQRFGHNDEARRQSAVIAMHVQNKDWSEECPDWSDWTA